MLCRRLSVEMRGAGQHVEPGMFHFMILWKDGHLPNVVTDTNVDAKKGQKVKQ